MTYKLVFAPQFEEDLDNTFDYIQKNLCAPQAAKDLMSEIDKSISFAAENPYMYPLCPEPLSEYGLRKIVVKNYIAVYSVNESAKTVNFLKLFFGRQNYLRFFTPFSN